MKENSEQLPDEQPERVYAELFEKFRESFFSIHKKCSISKQLQPHAKARDAAVTFYHMETLFPYDKKRSARMYRGTFLVLWTMSKDIYLRKKSKIKMKRFKIQTKNK